MAEYVPELCPLIIEMLQDVASSRKREVRPDFTVPDVAR